MSATTFPQRPKALLPTLLVAVVILSGFALFASLWGDKLWFDAVGFDTVFTVQFWTRIGLFLGVTVLVGALVAANMIIALRMRTANRPSTSAILDRYRVLLEERWKTVVLVPAALIGATAGVSAQTHVLTFLAWLNRTPFGTTDPKFGLDVSFYVFEYPIWNYLLSTVTSALLLGSLGALAVHFAVGNLRFDARLLTAKITPAGAHLSVLIGLILIAYGFRNLLDRFGLLLQDGSLITGLQYTDDNARMGAHLVVAVIAFICGLLFIANLWLNQPRIPLASVILMVVSGIIISAIYPAVIQSFQVKPNEPDKENPYIQANIEMTRKAYGISDVEVQEYAAVTQVRPGQLKEDAAALPGIRLVDPAIVGDTFEQLQQVRGYYSFSKVMDVDRYTIDGQETDAVVAAREIDLTGLPDQNWNNIHTVYTHGYGLVAAYGNRIGVMGEPGWIASDIPPQGKLTEFESRIYYGERSYVFAVVGREEGQDPIELDTPGGSSQGGEKNNVYSGTGGVPIGNALNRLVYATKFGDVNLLLSERVNSVSKLLYDRTPKQRVQNIAPWLTLDSNIYPAVVDGRVVWILDGYTTSNSFPSSQRASFSSATSDAITDVIGGQSDISVNYIRNSVKAVVDAYDGSVMLYAWDETDPILRTYMDAFPGTVKAKSDISPDLLSHLRYPEDLFKVQRQMLSRYHMVDAGTWYKQSDLWEVPAEPVKGKDTVKEPPYYLSIKWPGDKDPVFSLTTVYVPKGRSNLASYLAVNADAASPDYGKLRVLRMSDSQQIDGPGQTFNAITNNEAVANALLPYKQGSAQAVYGNLLTLPMGNGLLYVQPIYTTLTGSTGSYPALRFVVVRFGEHVGIGTTLQAALDSVFQGDAGVDTDEGTPTETPTTPTTPTGTVDQAAATAALKRAQEAFTAADAALRAGDLATYQAKNNEAKVAIAEALRAMGQ